jgi:KUP system potassium uptake protein
VLPAFPVDVLEASHPAIARSHRGGRPLLWTALSAIGVVFGDIGTSPLYTLRVAPEAQRGALASSDIFGVVSLILWALILAISVKYVTFVMRAGNRGEGGIFALLALLPRRDPRAGIGAAALLVIVGAALLFGDGMITPAISVLSALEGLEVAAPSFRRFVVPATCLVLLGLFSIQRRGTGAVGKVFGPVMVAWFLTIGVLGIKEIAKLPQICGALSPYWGALYFAHHGLRGLAILGVVVLAITGGEALYADMGHFGAGPIRIAWFTLALPAIALSYLGQGALVLRDPRTIANPFFAMVPTGPATYLLVGLATLATIIASQALISGVFSLTHQAVQLGYFPRVTVNHTSRDTEGEIYVPLINWGLMSACMALALAFRESTRLAAAYGIAVSGTMAITSVVFFAVTRKTWKWSMASALPLLVIFLSFDIPFFGANLLKLVDGGYVPIVAGSLFFVTMVAWHKGRAALHAYVVAKTHTLPAFLQWLPTGTVTRIPGTAIYLCSTQEGVPLTLEMQAKRLRSLAQHVVLLTALVEHEPQVAEDRRVSIDRHADGFVRIVIRFGYMENPEISQALARAISDQALGFAVSDATFYVGRETFIEEEKGIWRPLAEAFVAFLARNATSAVDHFGLPAERVVEIGARIDLWERGST